MPSAAPADVAPPDPAGADRLPDPAPTPPIGLLSWPGLGVVAGLMAGAAWFGQGAMVLLCGLIAATGLVARAWAGLSLVALDHRRELSARRAFPGETVTLTSILDNRKPLPLGWVGVDERLPPAVTMDNADGAFSTPLGWYRSARRQCRLACRRRGHYTIGPATLTSGDVFGLFQRSRTGAPAEPLIVYPRLYDPAELGLPARDALGDARDPSCLFEDPNRIAGLRDYTPDAPLKTIAWTASARSGRLQVKTFEPSTTLTAALFLAVDSFGPDADEETFELAVSTVASLADRLIDQRNAVAVFANGEQADRPGPVALAPARGDRQKLAVLERLAALHRDVATPFPALLDRHAIDLPRAATLCVVASRLPEPAVRRLEALAQRGYRAMVLVVGDAPAPAGAIPWRRIGGHG